MLTNHALINVRDDDDDDNVGDEGISFWSFFFSSQFKSTYVIIVIQFIVTK